jgi:hypothetical protein
MALSVLTVASVGWSGNPGVKPSRRSIYPIAAALDVRSMMDMDILPFGVKSGWESGCRGRVVSRPAKSAPPAPHPLPRRPGACPTYQATYLHAGWVPERVEYFPHLVFAVAFSRQAPPTLPMVPGANPPPVTRTARWYKRCAVAVEYLHHQVVSVNGDGRLLNTARANSCHVDTRSLRLLGGKTALSSAGIHVATRS